MSERTGVLLVNLGTTEAPTPRAVRRYLKEFLSDRAVVDKPPKPIWWLILRLFVLPRRPAKVAPLYRKIWLNDGPPLVVHTRAQRDALAAALGDGHRVAWAMRYGEPSIAAGIVSLAEQGCARILLVPMFPQVSKSSWGTAVGEAERVVARWRGAAPPRVHVVEPFYGHPGYVGAVSALLRAELARKPADHVLFSFHGIPVRFVAEGDPYRDHCEATAEAIARDAGVPAAGWTLAYQSRFGREPWLEPETAATVVDLARRHRSVVAVCPGFPADCLETVDEIGHLARESFLAAGGEDFRLVPGLNAHAAWIEGLTSIVRDGLAAMAR